MQLFQSLKTLLGKMRFPSYTAQGATGYEGGGRMGVWGLTLPGSDRDWVTTAGDPAVNSTAFGCLRWIADNVCEPLPTVVYRNRQNKDTPSPNHDLLKLLNRPNKDYDGGALLQATAVSYALSGNAYWLKERDNLGRVINLYWVPYWQMVPRWPAGGTEFITDYLYRPAGLGTGIPYDREDVVHFQWGLDPVTGGRYGVHRTFPVLREISALNEASTYMASILRNLGIVPYLIQPDASVPNAPTLDEEKARKFGERWRNLFTRDGRGKPFVPTFPVKIEKMGLSPNDMALGSIMQPAYIAVCNAFGIHPGVLHLAQGASGGGTGFDNGGQVQQARKASYEDCLIPMLKRFATTIDHQLLQVDYPVVNERYRCVWDFSTVQALREDQLMLAKVATSLYRGGVAMRSEARTIVHLAPAEDGSDDVYAPLPSGNSTTAVDETDALTDGEDKPPKEPPDATD